MKLRILIILACTMLGLSACVMEPYGYGGGGRGDHYSGDHYRGDEGHHDYGRRVWR